MDQKTLTQKLKTAQALLSEVYCDPALDSEANSSLSCADSCIQEVIQYLNPKPLATIYYQYFDPFIGGLREDEAPLFGNKSPEECAQDELKKHIDYKSRQLEFIKINFIQGA